MCPICWTLAVLGFLGIGGTTITLFVQANGWLSFGLMLFTSVVFWALTFKVVMDKRCKC
jgi:hypothetical protein